MEEEKAKFSVTVSANFEVVSEDPIYPLSNEQELSLGKDNNCDIKYNIIDLSSVHCYIQAVGDEIWYTDNYTKYGSYLKIKPKEHVAIKSNGFCLGHTIFTLERKDKENYILMYENDKGKESRELNTIKNALFYIGRDNNDQIQVKSDETISKKHAQVHYDLSTKNWVIKDYGRKGMGSSNGTWIKIGTATIIVNPEQIIRISKECFLTFKKL